MREQPPSVDAVAEGRRLRTVTGPRAAASAMTDDHAYIHAWAISVLSSRTIWWNAANFLIAALSLTEVVTLIPARFLPLQAAIVALVNLWLRTTTTRPVAFIAPGATKVIAVPKIDPPAPPRVGD